jgi:hypothetical protein
MTPFDLLFLVSFLASIGTLAFAFVCLLRGRAIQARRIVARYAVCLAVYFVVLVTVSLLTPARRLGLGERRCSDDWCIAVQSATASPSSSGTDYVVALRLSNRARGRPQRERGIVVYLTDAAGRRYDAVAQASDRPFDATIPAGESTDVTRRFRVASDAGEVSAVVAHEGSLRFPGLIIIGDEGSLLHKRTQVPLR